MANGKVIIETELDGSGFKEGLSKLTGMADSSGGKGGLMGRILGGSGGGGNSFGIGNFIKGFAGLKVVQAAWNGVTNSMGGAIDRFDTMNRFPKMMETMRYSAQDAQDSIDKLNQGVIGLPTALDTVVGTTQQLALMTGDLGQATDLTLALNNAFLASGATTGDASRGLTQFSQMLSRGEVDLISWRTLMETMPIALRQVADSFGLPADNAYALYDALKEGDITFDEFTNRIIELSGATGGFADQAQEASKGVKTSMENMGTAVVRGLEGVMSAFDEGLKSLTGKGISDWINTFASGIGKGFKVAEKGATGFFNFLNRFKPAFGEIGRVAGTALGNVAKFFQPVGTFIKEAGASLSVFSEFLTITIGQISRGDWAGAWDSLTSNISGRFRSLSMAFGNMVSGMGENVKQLANNMGEWFNSVDWSSVMNNIGNVIGNVLGKVIELGTSISNVFEDIFSYMHNLISNIDFGAVLDTIASTLGNIGSAIQSAIFTSLNATSWAEVGHTIMSNIGGAIGNAVHLIGDIGTQIFGWIADKLATVNWSSLGENIGTWVGEAIQNGIDGIKNFDFSTIDSMFKEIGNVIDELGQGLLEAAPKAIEGLAEALGLDREFDNIKRIIDGFAKIDWSGTANEFASSLKSAFQTAFSGFTLNDILPEIGFGHGDGTKTVIDWNQFFENIQMGATGKKAYVRIPVEATLESVHVTNPDDIEAEIRSQVSGTPAEVEKKVNALLDFILDENGNLTEEVIAYMRSQDITGNVDAHTFVDYLIDNDGDLMGAIQAMIDGQVSGQTATAKPQVTVNPNLVLQSGHSAGASMVGGVGLIGQIESLVQSMVPETPVPMSVPIAPQLTSGGAGASAEGESGFDLSGITAQITAELTALQTTVSTAMSNINTAIMTQASTWGTTISTAMTTMVTSVTATMTAMTLVVTLALTALTIAVSMAMTSLSESVTQTMTSMAETVTQAMSDMANAITEAINAMVEAVTAGMEEAVAAAEAGAEGIVDAVSGLYDSMYSAGQSAGEGLADGLNSMQGAVSAAAAALASAANVAAQAAFIINSPSKVWRSFGYSAGEGLIDGFDGSQRSVEKSATRLAMAGLPKVNSDYGLSYATAPTFRKRRSSVANQPNNDGISQKIDEVISAIQNGQVIALDTGALVGGTANQMDGALGEISQLGGRHRL